MESPWLHTAEVDVLETHLLDAWRSRQTDTEVLERAIALAKRAHLGQTRRSGEPYICHPLNVASAVAVMGLDEASVIAAVCHDVIEDCGIDAAELAEGIGGDVGREAARLVEGVTKVDRLHFDSSEEADAATLVKMLVAVAGDARVLLVKLADRWHNMETLWALSETKQRKIAKETLAMYAPLARRLGLVTMAGELEDLAFRYTNPTEFAALDAALDADRSARRDYLTAAVDELSTALRQAGIDAEITWREKRVYSAWAKMVGQGLRLEQLRDLAGIRVIVGQGVGDCYRVLGVVHSTWTPVPGSFNDYVALPKTNMYQSLHTAVSGPGGQVMEVQIRTSEMHERAEFGVAAHFAYKEAGRGAVADESLRTSLLEHLAAAREANARPMEVVNALAEELAVDEVYIFTPKGRVVILPEGSTAVDFAYAVHTEIGHRSVGAKVNGELVALGTELVSGDVVEVLTRAGSEPGRDRLGLAKTPRAIGHLRAHLNRRDRHDNRRHGREVIERAWAAMTGVDTLDEDEIAELVRHSGLADAEALWLAMGEGRLDARELIVRARRGEGEVGAVRLGGMWGDVTATFATCCSPAPGDDVAGYVSKGGGIIVHRRDCAVLTQQRRDADATRLSQDRTGGGLEVAVEVTSVDRTGLLRDVGDAFSDLGVSVDASSSVVGHGFSTARYWFKVAEPQHLDELVERLREVPSVHSAVVILDAG